MNVTQQRHTACSCLSHMHAPHHIKIATAGCARVENTYATNTGPCKHIEIGHRPIKAGHANFLLSTPDTAAHTYLHDCTRLDNTQFALVAEVLARGNSSVRQPPSNDLGQPTCRCPINPTGLHIGSPSIAPHPSVPDLVVTMSNQTFTDKNRPAVILPQRLPNYRHLVLTAGVILLVYEMSSHSATLLLIPPPQAALQLPPWTCVTADRYYSSLGSATQRKRWSPKVHRGHVSSLAAHAVHSTHTVTHVCSQPAQRNAMQNQTVQFFHHEQNPTYHVLS